MQEKLENEGCSGWVLKLSHMKFGSKRVDHKVASSNTSCLEAHAGFFRLLMKGIFDTYVQGPFDKKLISLLVTHVRIHDYTEVPIFFYYAGGSLLWSNFLNNSTLMIKIDL